MYWVWQKESRRPSWDEYFMMIAQISATRSTCNRGPKQLFVDRSGTGAVIVSPDRRKLSIGYNGSPPSHPHCDDEGHLMVDGHCVRTIHAEENAIINCAFDTYGCSIYTTTVPCYDCAKRIVSAGIKSLFYLDDYESRYSMTCDSLKCLERSSVDVKRIPRDLYLCTT